MEGALLESPLNISFSVNFRHLDLRELQRFRSEPQRFSTKYYKLLHHMAPHQSNRSNQFILQSAVFTARVIM